VGPGLHEYALLSLSFPSTSSIFSPAVPLWASSWSVSPSACSSSTSSSATLSLLIFGYFILDLHLNRLILILIAFHLFQTFMDFDLTLDFVILNKFGFNLLVCSRWVLVVAASTSRYRGVWIGKASGHDYWED
jgi:hypothetical protein